MELSSHLVVDDRPALHAIRSCAASSEELLAALADASSAAERAALLFALADKNSLSPAADRLLELLASDDLDGRAAAWALARCPEIPTSALLERCQHGNLDTRENAYRALAHRAALGQQTPTASDLIACIDTELERVAGGRSGLGERACLVLAILGDSTCQEQISRVLDADRFCDRFELQRQRKALDDHGHDHESRELFGSEWPTCFADDLIQTEASDAVEPEAAPEVDDAIEPEDDLSEEDDAAAGLGIDWQDFADSEEAQALPEQIQQVIVQFGPILEQLAQRGLGKALTDCRDQEFALLLLQVLPQALPPQYVQIALSPQGLQGLRAVCDYLERTQPGSGASLAAGLDLVRQEIQAQMRASGNLNSSIYDEPDQNPLV